MRNLTESEIVSVAGGSCEYYCLCPTYDGVRYNGRSVSIDDYDYYFLADGYDGVEDMCSSYCKEKGRSSWQVEYFGNDKKRCCKDFSEEYGCDSCVPLVCSGQSTA